MRKTRLETWRFWTNATFVFPTLTIRRLLTKYLGGDRVLCSNSSEDSACTGDGDGGRADSLFAFLGPDAARSGALR
jgi:hypothetical protein